MAVLGARLPRGASTWSDVFVMADVPGFPDCNTCMMIDKHQKLWLFWPIILDNHWESALTNYRTSSDYQSAGAPRWDWQGVIWLKPADFKTKAMELLSERVAKLPEPPSDRMKGLFRFAREAAEQQALAAARLAAALQADGAIDRPHLAAAV